MYSVAGRTRNNGKENYKAETGHRQHLYVEYLQVIADHWPAVFVMERVKGLLSASVNERQMFQGILDDLKSPQDALRREQRSIENTKRRHSYRVLPLTSRNTSNGIGPTPGFRSDYRMFWAGIGQCRQRWQSKIRERANLA